MGKIHRLTHTRVGKFTDLLMFFVSLRTNGAVQSFSTKLKPFSLTDSVISWLSSVSTSLSYFSSNFSLGCRQAVSLFVDVANLGNSHQNRKHFVEQSASGSQLLELVTAGFAFVSDSLTASNAKGMAFKAIASLSQPHNMSFRRFALPDTLQGLRLRSELASKDISNDYQARTWAFVTTIAAPVLFF